MSVTVNLPGNLGDPKPIQTDVTKEAAIAPYVGLVNAPATWSASAKSIYNAHLEPPDQPPSWKVS